MAEKAGSEYLIPLYWSGSDPDDIPFDILPPRFVLKTNHGCGFLIIVKDSKSLNRESAKRKLRKWLGINYCHDVFLGIGWAYKDIAPKVIVEELLDDNGKVPVDYKFWCFGGRVEFVSLHFDRFTGHATLSRNRDFEPGGLHFDLPTYQGDFKRPGNYNEMVRLAETLSREYEFMRVDCYNVNGRILIGEMTPYPGGVAAKFEPEAMDFLLGDKWNGLGQAFDHRSPPKPV